MNINVVDKGIYSMVVYYGDSFYGLCEGIFKIVLLYGYGLGVEVKFIGFDGNLISGVDIWCLVFYGIIVLSKNWSLVFVILV